ncbi:MAG: carboxyl transferase domain-containing protein [Parvularculaceae bacterium]
MLSLRSSSACRVVHFVDNPGFMIGLEAEKAATIRRGVEVMNAIYKMSVPWASVIVRKAFGVAGAAMSNHTRYQYRFAWPSGDWGSLPMEGGVEVAYKAELEKAEDPAAAIAAIKAHLKAVTLALSHGGTVSCRGHYRSLRAKRDRFCASSQRWLTAKPRIAEPSPLLKRGLEARFRLCRNRSWPKGRVQSQALARAERPRHPSLTLLLREGTSLALA